jgi:hypothetical protein
LRNQAKPKDPAWKYAFLPKLERKDLLQCTLCNKHVYARVPRMKRHLCRGYSDVEKRPKATAENWQEINKYLKTNSRKFRSAELDLDGEDENAADDAQVAQHENTKGAKKSSASAKRKEPGTSFQVSRLPQKKSVVDMIRKTLKEVVAEQHASSMNQLTMEHSTKKTKEQKQIVDDHVAAFLYENCIPLNVVNSRNREVLLESIEQYGPGYRSPTYHEVRVRLLERAKSKRDELKKHEQAWKEYGCTLMSDGWTDKKGYSLINYLVNRLEDNLFLGSSNLSSESVTAELLAQLLEQPINVIRKENVIQLVTDNGANHKAARRMLMDKFPALFWTPCAAHCLELDLMLEDIGKIKEFSGCIAKAKITIFTYGHERIHDLMRTKTNGGDLVRPTTNRFATSFLNLASMWKVETIDKGSKLSLLVMNGVRAN